MKRVPVQGLAVTALASGQADIALQMLPELMANKDVALADRCPIFMAPAWTSPAASPPSAMMR